MIMELIGAVDVELKGLELMNWLWWHYCQGCWACLLFEVQRSSVGSERGVVVLDELLEEVFDEV